MTTLRNDAQGRQMELSTGNFSISPRYGNNGKIEGWQGQAEIVLQGATLCASPRRRPRCRT
jgi:predicted secreted protein